MNTNPSSRAMRRPARFLRGLTAVPALLLALTAAQGARYGASGVAMESESLNGGGTAMASSGAIRLGGSLGQNNFIETCTNSDVVVQNGFWKAEDACTLYNPAITNTLALGGNVRITFAVVNSNHYEVLAVNQEEGGGVMSGSHAFTNAIASFVGQGVAGSSTGIWDLVGSGTNRAKFYLIRCGP